MSHNKGRVFWLIGQKGSGKTTLASKLYKFLQTEKRNWRRDVFHVDDTVLRELYDNNDTTEYGQFLLTSLAQSLVTFLHNNGCDVVVSTISPEQKQREKFKEKLGSDIQEIYVHTNTPDKRDLEVGYFEHYQEPESNFIDVDTTKDSPDKSFSKIINNLHKLNKL
jgi:adenylylsulfate kinase-like enzyme